MFWQRKTTPDVTTAASSHLKNERRFLLLRLVSGVIILGCTLLVITNIPIFYDYVYVRAETSDLLSGFGISPHVVAILRTLIRRFGELMLLGMAWSVLFNSHNTVALMLALVAALAAPSISGSTLETTAALPHLALPILFVPVLSTGLGALMVFTAPDGRFVPEWSRWILPFFVAFEVFRDYFFDRSPFPGLFWILPFALVFILSIWALVNRYRHSSAVYRQQIKWLSLGITFLVIGVVLTQVGYLIFPRGAHILSAGLDEVGGLCCAVCILFAIQRHRLYNIDLVINRSIVMGSVALMLGMVFVLLFVVFNLLLFRLLPTTERGIALVLPSVFCGLLYNPLRRQTQHFVDRQLYGFRFDLDQLEQTRPLPIDNPGYLSGRTIGGYEIRGVIGKGGMSEVYEGYGEGQKVALKILARDLTYDFKALQRFRREAQIVAQLRHSHIVRLITYGDEAGTVYLVLEYVAGETLKDVLARRGKLNIGELRGLLASLADTLDYAHDMGIVHRDLKPSNIMFRASSSPTLSDMVLMDFGVAKLPGEATTLTGTGAVGSIDYMAPEQIRKSWTVDRRADVYALGVIFYEALTGEKPFEGSNPAQVLFAHLQQPPLNPCYIAPELPPEAGDVLLRALAKDPADRYSTASGLCQALLNAYGELVHA